MNSLSKVTLLVTFLTVPFAGFAMDNAEQETSTVWKYFGFGALVLGGLVITYKYVTSPKKPTVDVEGTQGALQPKTAGIEKDPKAQPAPQGGAVALNATETENAKRNPQATQQPVQQAAVASVTKAESVDKSSSLLDSLGSLFGGKASASKEDVAPESTQTSKESSSLNVEAANAEAKAKNPITVAIAKGKLDSATLAEWAKNPKKLNDKLTERGITMAHYQAWVNTQSK